MSREYGDYDILEFVCGGAKQYALKMRHRQTGEEKFVLKIRGIPLDFNASVAISYDSFKVKTLCDDDEEEAVTFSYDTIQPDRWSRVTTKKSTKRWNPHCLKGVILADHRIVPFGYQ